LSKKVPSPLQPWAAHLFASPGAGDATGAADAALGSGAEPVVIVSLADPCGSGPVESFFSQAVATIAMGSAKARKVVVVLIVLLVLLGKGARTNVPRRRSRSPRRSAKRARWQAEQRNVMRRMALFHGLSFFVSAVS
jgi:hypothetical protein